MDPFPAIRRWLARLADAPLAASSPFAHRPPVLPRSSVPSGLYADDPWSGDERRTRRQRDGDAGERLARRHLEQAGLTFVAAQVRYRDSELDLVMWEARRGPGVGHALVFVEVRRRAGETHGGAIASITAAKRRRIVAAAAHYLTGLGLRTLPPCRFDVVTIDGDAVRGFRVEWLRDAFRGDG